MRREDEGHDAELLADEQPEHDAERQRREQHVEGHAVQRDAGIGEAEDRHDDEGDADAERVFEPVKRRAVMIVGAIFALCPADVAERNGEREHDPGERGVDAGEQHGHPQAEAPPRDRARAASPRTS